MRRFPYQFLLRYLGNVLSARYGCSSNRKSLQPMIASFYLTLNCNFRCSYCDDGSGNMYPDIAENRLNTAQTIEVLEILRTASPGLSITGGEPTVRADIDEIFEHIDRLGFCPVTFNTNGFLINSHLSLLHHIDYLIVSLDSVDEKRGDALINLSSTGQTKRVRNNLEKARDYRRANKLKFDFIVNTVVFPETIDDAWEVFEFCLENEFYWTPMPYIVGKYPCPGLVDNPRWLELIDTVLRAKRNGARIYGNLETLRTIRDFKRFECYPTTHPVIYPNGNVYYPCSPLNKVAANLLEIGDYYEAVRLGELKHGPVPYCDARCHVGCHTESSTSISHPAQGIFEAVRYVFGARNCSLRIKRPQRATLSSPPGIHELRKLPSMPPDKIRQLRQEGKIENDWTSSLRIKSAETTVALVRLTRN
jgi:MoaA/NifB/PqqE/SkfB family radical SAM enzyme